MSIKISPGYMQIEHKGSKNNSLIELALTPYKQWNYIYDQCLRSWSLFLCNIANFHFNFNILQRTKITTLKPRLGVLCYYEEINYCIVHWCKLILISIWSSHGIQYKKCSKTVKHPASSFSCSKLKRNVKA